NQVFLNIITNAIYAINKKFNGDSGGILEICTEADDENISISVKDNGIGMPEDIKEKVFEPFFTTKEVGEGTGLGMSIVYNTIKKHKGEIKIESQVGEGTMFIISLPILQQNAEVLFVGIILYLILFKITLAIYVSFVLCINLRKYFILMMKPTT